MWAGKWGIIAATFIVMTGAGSIFPVLPLFLGDRGASFTLTGLVVSAYLVGNFSGQYPAGWLADRVGRRPVMVGGLLVAAAFTAAMVLPVGIIWLIAFRFLGGIGAAAYFPASRAMLADLVPEAERGAAYGWLSSARLAGFITGPAIGGFLALGGRQTVFAATTVALVLAAAVIIFALPSSPLARSSPPLAGAPFPLREGQGRGSAQRLFLRGRGFAKSSSFVPAAALARPSRNAQEVPAPVTSAAEAERPVAGLGRLFAGLLALSVGFGLLVGAYTTVWSLFMRAIGGTDWQIGLSLSLFAAPAVVVAPLAGIAADRWSKRLLAAGGVAFAGLVAMIYPLLNSVPLVIGLGVVEGAGISFFDPASNALLMETVPADRRGRYQGGLGAANSAAMAVGAAAGGALFGLGVGMPFWVTGAICVVSSVVGLVLLGGRVPAPAGAAAEQRIG
jgi:DHA1 family multidrug resistance protein-like MFS transporter